MRRWSFGKRCWVQGGERKSKWLESVYKEELTNDLFPLAIDNLFLPKEDARGNTQPGALVGDTLPVLGHPEPTPLTEAEQPQWLLYLARMAETFGRTRDTFRITKQLFKLKCDKRELISLAELRLLDSAYTNTINPIRNMYKTGIRIERRLREQTRIRVQIGRKAADDKAFTAAESSLLASKEIEQTAENMLTVRNKLMHSDVASLHVVDLWSNNPRARRVSLHTIHHSQYVGFLALVVHAHNTYSLSHTTSSHTCTVHTNCIPTHSSWIGSLQPGNGTRTRPMRLSKTSLSQSSKLIHCGTWLRSAV